jgi:GT2 family glycosyltransferase
MSKVALVVAVLNNHVEFTELVASAKTHKNELKIYTQLQNRHQVPLAKAWNNGIREATADGCEYIIVSNDDVLFAPFTIDEMVERASSSLANYKLASSGKEPVLFAPLDVGETFDDPLEIIWSKKSTEFKFREQELFSCFMITPRTIELVGTFDENFDPAWFEDNSYHRRINLGGFDVIKFPVPYIHRGSTTTKKLTRPMNSLKSQQYYEAKWGSVNRSIEPDGERFQTPYGNPNLTIRDWIPNYMEKHRQGLV